jgi:hypothetical protein
VDGSVLAALYQVEDSRHLPAHLSLEGAGLGYVARPRHRVKLARRAGSHDLVRAVARLPTLDPFHGVEDPSRNTVTFAQLKRGGHDRAVGWSQSSATLERHQGHRHWGDREAS